MSQYYKLVGLENVFLEDSFVLAVYVQPGEVDFGVEVVLTESHPEFSAPKEREKYCYRRGHLRFLGVQQVRWQMGDIEPARDATGEIDYGGFDRFEFESNDYTVAGDFGTLEIRALKCELSIDSDD